ncbi:family 1 glycosylhydrolase [Klebsiella pneumoniae subsp. pneumoniae]|nr:family 1 glycosylhydrolase [Klebsiella pneumoniae subsp. pneumoniae]
MMIKAHFAAIFRYISLSNGLGAKDPIIDLGKWSTTRGLIYLSSHIGAPQALALGLDVRLLPWSFILDLLSWLNGYQKQYGLSMSITSKIWRGNERRVFYWYKSVAASHGEQR